MTQKSKKCSICLREKYEYYSVHNVFKSFHALIFPDLIGYNSEKKYYNKNNSQTNSPFDEVIIINDNLIRPCKCLKAIHYQCLMNQCLFLLSFKCSECKWVYAVDFLPKNNKIITRILLPLLLIIFFLIGALVFFSIEIIPSKYSFWNYIIGLIMLFFSLAHCFILFYSRKTNKIFENAIILPYDDNKEQNDQQVELINKKIREYSMSKYNMTDIELIEHKNSIFNVLYLCKEQNLSKTIQMMNGNSIKCDEDEQKNEELEKRFENTQLIKSSLIVKPEYAMNIINNDKAKNKKKGHETEIYKSKTKTNQSNADKSPMNRTPLQQISRTPLLMIKEAKELLEDFSPVNSLDGKKKKTMNFLLSFGPNKKAMELQSFLKAKKHNNLLLTLKNNQ